MLVCGTSFTGLYCKKCLRLVISECKEAIREVVINLMAKRPRTIIMKEGDNVMKGVSHAIIGVSLSAVILNELGQPYGLTSAVVAGLGSLFPDIDEETSLINKYIPFKFKKLIYAILGGYFIYQLFTEKDIAFLIPAILSLFIFISGHRGFTHSIMAAVIFSISFVATPSLFYSFIIGYGLHLICDMLNEKGIALLYPMKKMIKFPMRFPMNSIPGMVLEIGIVIFSSYLYCQQIGII